MKTKTLILFTKKFPYGHQETYLFDELPYLIKEFKKVIIVPYDEYNYNNSENRISNIEAVEILKINTLKIKFSVYQKIVRELTIVKLFFIEIFNGREKSKHLLKFKNIASQLRHLYLNALVLTKHLNTNYTNDFVFYNYWMHRGVLLSYFSKKTLQSNVKIVTRAHAYDLYHNDWLKMLEIHSDMFLPFEFVKLKICDNIFSISQHGLNHFNTHFYLFKNKYSMARLGVKDYLSDVSSFDNKVNTTKLLITCSSINDRKRIYLMPSILSKLNFSYQWYHIGSGSNTDLAHVENEIKKYNIEPHCKLLGLMPHQKIIEFYKKNTVHLFFNLSTAEGIPVSLMEAASFGIPMVATNTIGNPEIVNNDNGFLIDVDFNSEEVAQKINKWNADTVAILHKRKASRDMFEDKYSAQKNYTNFALQLSRDE